MDDAHAAHCERDAAQRPHRRGEDAEDVGEPRQHIGEGDVVLAVAGGEQAPDLARHAGGGGALAVGDVDLHQPVTVVEGERTPGGKVGGVVQVGAEKLALRRHHPDHAVALAADAHPLAQRVGVAEELLLEGGPRHHEGARANRVVGRQEAPGTDLHGKHAVHAGAHPIHGGARHPPGRLYLRVAEHDGGHARHQRQARDGGRIVEGELAGGARQPGRTAARAGAPRADLDDVGAELGEFLQHELVQAFADRGEQDHRGDAHGDAQQGEEAAQPMRDEGAQGDWTKSVRVIAWRTPRPDRGGRRGAPAVH